MSVSPSGLHQIVDHIHSIPSLPEVVTQVVRLVDDPTANTKQIHAIVLKDPAMAAKMLSLVNSVFYGLHQPVRDLEQALNILGPKTVRSIAMSISVVNMFQQQRAGFSMKSYWTHSGVSASICRLIARRSGVCDPELAFIIGLLRDVGKLVLVQNATEEMRQIISLAQHSQLSFHQAARDTINTDEAEVGAWLCAHWKLDPLVIQAIRWQHDLAQSPEPKLTAMCQFSEYLCALKNIRSVGDCDPPTLDPQAWVHLGLDPELLVEILEEVNEEVAHARQLLQLTT